MQRRVFGCWVVLGLMMFGGLGLGGCYPAKCDLEVGGAAADGEYVWLVIDGVVDSGGWSPKVGVMQSWLVQVSRIDGRRMMEKAQVYGPIRERPDERIELDGDAGLVRRREEMAVFDEGQSDPRSCRLLIRPEVRWEDAPGQLPAAARGGTYASGYVSGGRAYLPLGEVAYQFEVKDGRWWFGPRGKGTGRTYEVMPPEETGKFGQRAQVWVRERDGGMQMVVVLEVGPRYEPSRAQVEVLVWEMERGTIERYAWPIGELFEVGEDEEIRARRAVAVTREEQLAPRD